MLSLRSSRIKLSQHSSWCAHVDTNCPEKSDLRNRWQMRFHVKHVQTLQSALKVCGPRPLYIGGLGLNLHVPLV